MSQNIKMLKDKGIYCKGVIYVVGNNTAHGLIDAGFAELNNVKKEEVKVEKKQKELLPEKKQKKELPPKKKQKKELSPKRKKRKKKTKVMIASQSKRGYITK